VSLVMCWESRVCCASGVCGSEEKQCEDHSLCGLRESPNVL
jgi:hypothetical protein